jgi:DNA-binding MarR family transcriptional regulator
MRSKEQKEAAILWCLKRAPEGLRGLELCDLTGVWQGSIYVYLARLEDRGLVRMEFEPGPKPRRSRYYLVRPEMKELV